MDLYHTGESGVVAVQPLESGEASGLGDALLRGRGGTLGAEDVLFVTTTAGDGAATALAVDVEGAAVVVGAVDGEVESDAVTDALQRASAVADRPYEALDEQYGEGSLREAHADYFDREPLAPGAFNDDQRVRLLGTAFAGEALELAAFLSDRELSVDPVLVEAFAAPGSEGFLVRFDEDAADAATADGAEQSVAGARADDGGEPDGSEGTEPSNESTLAADDDATGADGTEPLELPALLDAVAEGIRERLVGTFDADPETMVSVERGNELLVRPDHPAYAGGVLRYRLQVDADGTVEFGVNIYGGSEAEKEQMRAVVRENEAPIEEELGYDVADDYDGFAASRQFASFDQAVAAEIVDEFDRLVRLFHSRVMRA